MIKQYLCPKCRTELRWREISSGGDGITYCPKCDWYEDFKLKLEDQVILKYI